jgi:hypothetical protein
MAKKPKTPADICPCCKQAKPQPRQVRLTTFAPILAGIWRRSEGAFIKVPAFEFHGTHAQMKYWGVIEDQKYKTKAGELRTRSGVWRVTETGRRWIEGETTLPAEATILMDEVFSWSTTRLTFEQALEISKTKGAAKALAAKIADDEGYRLYSQEQARMRREEMGDDDDEDEDEG